MKKVTLKELGPCLPIPVPGLQNQFFKFKNWGLAEEKKIGEIKRKSNHMGPFVNEVLSMMLEECGGIDFTKKETHEKKYEIHKMPMMNILYLWIYLRYDQLDEEIRMNVGCPGCGRVNQNFVANLQGLDIEVPEQDDANTIEYKLRKSFEVDGKLISSFKINRTTWGCMDSADDETTTNQGKIMEIMFKNSICGVNDETGYMDVDKILQNVKKIDIEHLSNAIQKHNAGPTLSVEGKCSFCPTTFFKTIDWSYDSFFGSSSLPVR